MSNYDGQLIIEFKPDGAIETGSELITHKAEQATLGPVTYKVTIRDNSPASPMERTNLKYAFHELMRLKAANLRLYLHGHGAWQKQTLGGWTPEQVARLLKDTGCPDFDTVSVTGCSLGRDENSAVNVGVAGTMNSFASNLHRLLWTECEMKTRLTARVYLVGHSASGPMKGRKWTRRIKGGLKKHQRPRSKLTYYWAGDTQAREWSYSGEDVAA